LFAVVEAVGKEGKVGEKVEAVGERVGVEVAKKGVVGEGVVENTKGGLVTEVEEECVDVPEEIICWFVAHMKMGRPIVSFARVSISSFSSRCCFLAECLQELLAFLMGMCLTK
jgi:hypothetical protein